jgi:polysaccharide biosynthesis transport protein
VASYSDDRPPRDEWNVSECLQILYRHKTAIAWIALLGVLLAAAVTALQPREYQTRASLEMRAFNDGYLDLRNIYPLAESSAEAASFMQTQAEILQQDNLLEQVARKLNLESRPEYRSARSITSRLREDLQIVPVKNSRIIQIVANARSAPLSADVANTLAEAFVEQNAEQRQEEARQTYQFLQHQLEELRVPRARAGNLPGANRVDVGFYEATLQKAYNAYLASRMRLSNARLAGPATPPLLPRKPNLLLNLGIGAIGGLLIAIAWVMLREQSRPVLRAPGDAGVYLSLPELGAIPQARNGKLFAAFFPGLGNGSQGVERAVMEQRMELSESFRTTVASILANGRGGRHPRVLVVTSSQPMEGKTTVVSNLGIALAAASKKVLLIDGDMRRPRLHKLFDEANSWGLSDLLSEKNAVHELPLDVLAKRTAIPHLYLLPSGASTDNVFGLLYSDRLARLLPLFREQFDYVLVDAPPCLEFADARIMARHAEEVLLVVRANHTDRRAAQTAVRRFRLDGISVMGVILNRWAPAPGDPYAGQTDHFAGPRRVA